MWQLLKELWAAVTSVRAAKAAAELPAGQAAVESIKADGEKIQAALTSKPGAPK